MERKLLWASVRTVVQLLLLGYVLLPIFRFQHALPVVLLCVGMVALAARETVQRTKRRFSGLFSAAFVALLVGAMSTSVFGVAAVVAVSPWWSPRYLVPLAGMMLGNMLTGMTLGIDKLTSELDEGRGRVEVLLALGATRWEAAKPVMREAVRVGMIPIINSMSVVGLVTIPGMMTGQLLGGASPEVAARYQIMVMFLIAAATALGVTLSVLLCIVRLFDAEHRLRVERIGT
jgi:putative ABC transport system permease protein